MSMKVKETFKTPKVSDSEAAKLSQAAQYAYGGNDESERFMDASLEKAMHYRKLRLSREAGRN